MASLSHQTIGFAGAAVSYVAAEVGGDFCTADPKSFLHVKNGGGAPINVTIAVAGTTNGQNNADVVVAVPNGGERMIGPLVPELTGADTLGLVLLTYSAVTSVTVAVVQVGDPPAPLP